MSGQTYLSPYPLFEPGHTLGDLREVSPQDPLLSEALERGTSAALRERDRQLELVERFRLAIGHNAGLRETGVIVLDGTSVEVDLARLEGLPDETRKSLKAALRAFRIPPTTRDVVTKTLEPSGAKMHLSFQPDSPEPPRPFPALLTERLIVEAGDTSVGVIHPPDDQKLEYVFALVTGHDGNGDSVRIEALEHCKKPGKPLPPNLVWREARSDGATFSLAGVSFSSPRAFSPGRKTTGRIPRPDL